MVEPWRCQSGARATKILRAVGVHRAGIGFATLRHAFITTTEPFGSNRDPAGRFDLDHRFHHRQPLRRWRMVAERMGSTLGCLARRPGTQFSMDRADGNYRSTCDGMFGKHPDTEE